MSNDEPLGRLYDYTKFHIGIYIVAAGTMVTIAGSKELHGFFGGLIKHSNLMLGAIAAMAMAGLAGGVIASTCATADNLSSVWNSKIGPWNVKVMPGYWWARVEHTSFWLSAALFVAAALWPS